VRHLNYTHLLYFWTVVQEGSITAASKALNLTPQTISGQIKLLEQSVGESLFNRVGRGLVLTDTGRVVNGYADEIFRLGTELTQRVKSKMSLTPSSLKVGIADSIAKLIVLRMLKPILAMKDKVRIICYESTLDVLLADLAVHKLDLVLSDRPVPTGLNVKAYNHPLGKSDVSFFAHNTIARNYQHSFPDSLNNAPMLMPLGNSSLRRSLNDWFDRQGVTPDIIAEFDDSALLKAFGEAGLGVFPAPTAIAEEVCSMYHSTLLGPAKGVSETYYAITCERKLKLPAIVAITESARETLFSN
jgi:LysR family transcriptional activator of nhaA